MSLLFISIASSGLVKRALTKDSPQQPWICWISAVLMTPEGSPQQMFSVGIRAESRKIEPMASRSHGIASAAAERGGIYELFALGAICGLKAGPKRAADYPGLASCAHTVIAWDAEFTRTVISNVFSRHGEPATAWLRPGLSFLSLRDIARPWCKLEPAEGSQDGGYRYPSRNEAAQILLGAEPRPKPHSPDSNLETERALYFALRERNAFEDIAA